ncbi:MAG: acyltransferase [Bacteroidota bacterium]|nr:acyltransferase [Bacteroidota bacterium]
MSVTNLSERKQTRLHGLDYLRGLSAFGIMLYHCASWTLGSQTASSFLGRIGIYGVAIFYVLSGLTLGYVYQATLHPTARDLWTFYKRRIYRIFPLLWLATLASIVLSKHLPNPTDLILNLTGLFGFFRWNTYFATGAWSIGNELTFYLIFPPAVFLFRNSRLGFIALLFVILGILVYFAYILLNQCQPLAEQWHSYTNPLNQVFFFLAGFTISRLINPKKARLSFCLMSASLGALLFWVIRVPDGTINLVTGHNRLLFVFSCLLICAGFFRASYANSWIEKPLARLGQVSYSLYLLHPLVYAVVKLAATMATKRGIHIGNLFTIAFAVIISLIISNISYIYFENYFIRLSHSKDATLIKQ